MVMVSSVSSQRLASVIKDVHVTLLSIDVTDSERLLQMVSAVKR